MYLGQKTESGWQKLTVLRETPAKKKKKKKRRKKKGGKKSLNPARINCPKSRSQNAYMLANVEFAQSSLEQNGVASFYWQGVRCDKTCSKTSIYGRKSVG